MRRVKTPCGARAAALLLAIALPAAARGDSCRLVGVHVPVTLTAGRPVVVVGINGTQVPMLLDTGAFYSFINPAESKELHLSWDPLPQGLRVSGIAGWMSAHLTRVDHLAIAQGEVTGVSFIVGGDDLGHGIKGYLGRNIMGSADSEYDLSSGNARIVAPDGDCRHKDLAYWAHGAPVIEIPFRTNDDEAYAPARVKVLVNGHELNAEFDTGSSFTFITRNGARKAGIDDTSLKPAAHGSGAGSGTVSQWTTTLAKFQIGGETISNSRVGVIDTDWLDTDLVLGLDYYLSHRLYFSRLQHKVYATWNGAPVFGPDAVVAAASSGADASASPPPQDADAWARRGEGLAAQRDFTHALADLDQACAMSPTTGRYFAARARVHAALHQVAAMRQDDDEALRLDPTDVQTRLARADARRALGDRQGALDDLNQIDRSLPAGDPLRGSLGKAYLDLGLGPDALRVWAPWLPNQRGNVSSAAFFNASCWTRLRLHLDEDRALDECQQAVDLDDRTDTYQWGLGWAHLRLANWYRAHWAFDRAIALNAKAPWALLGRGLVRIQQGDRVGGQADLAAARGIDPRIEQKALDDGLLPKAAAH